MSTHLSPENLDSLNPFMVVRIAMGKSQKDMSELAHVTVPYIYRQERGLVNTPIGSISDILNNYLDGPDSHSIVQDWADLLHVDVGDSPTIDDLYYRWVVKKRELVRDGSIIARSINNDLLGLLPEQRLPAFMHNFVKAYNKYYGASYAESQQSFSRILAMHPRNWQLLADKFHGNRRPKTVNMPGTFKEVLLECGASQNLLDWLVGKSALDGK